jgi:hypothetical protein
MQAFSPSPIPRHGKISRPDSAAFRSRLFLLLHVIAGVARERDCPSSCHQPSIDVFACKSALGDNSMVAINIALLTLYRPPADMVLQSQRCMLSASPQ